MILIRKLNYWLLITLALLASSLLISKSRTTYCGPLADCAVPNGIVIISRGFPFTMIQKCYSDPIDFGMTATGKDYCYDYLPNTGLNIVYNFIVYSSIVAVVFVVRNTLWHNKSRHKH